MRDVAQRAPDYRGTTVLQIVCQGLGNVSRQWQEPFPSLFGLPQVQSQVAPIHVVQGQGGDFVGSQRQLRKAQRNRKVPSANGAGPVKGMQKLAPGCLIQDLGGPKAVRCCRVGHSQHQARADAAGKLKESQKTAQANRDIMNPGSFERLGTQTDITKEVRWPQSPQAQVASPKPPRQKHLGISPSMVSSSGR